MFIGYDMFRNLAQGKHMKKKSHKEDFRKFLVDPGMCVGGRSEHEAVAVAVSSIIVFTHDNSSNPSVVSIAKAQNVGKP